MADRVKQDVVIQDPMSSGLLMNGIRTMTSTASHDQRELERSRLRSGYEQSGLAIDKLLSEHRADVNHCLSSFREVSNGVTSARERIQNAKNALHTCKTLLQSRKDDLKKLWMESAEQAHVNNILQQIYEIKHLEKTVEVTIQEAKYKETVAVLKRADILLNGPLSEIDGLSQLRSNISDTSQHLFERMVSSLLEIIISTSFDSQVFEIMKGLSEQTLNESAICIELTGKYASDFAESERRSGTSTASITSSNANMLSSTPVISMQLIHRLIGVLSGRKRNAAVSSIDPLGRGKEDGKEELREKMVEIIEALKVFDQLDSAVEQFFLRSASRCHKSVNDTIDVLRLTLKDAAHGDESHLSQLVQTTVSQMRKSAEKFSVFADEIGVSINNSKQAKDLTNRFWDILQGVMESLVSDHLDIRRTRDGSIVEGTGGQEAPTGLQQQKKRTLFSFENTTFVSSANSSLLKKKRNLICPANVYNITSVYHVLNRFAAEIDKQVASDRNPQCRLTTFLHSFVMDTFVERVRMDMESKMEHSLISCGDGDGVWSALSPLPSHPVKVLTSSIKVLELAKQIDSFMAIMDAYVQRFAFLWVHILADYTKSATDMYSQIIKTRNQHQQSDDTTTLESNSKISASWAADEDINRLLKSMPSWGSISQATAGSEQTPMVADMKDMDKESRHRTVRESELLIGNLGSQKQIQKAELVTDMEHIRALACMHESLQWFSFQMRAMINSLPSKSKDALRCKIQFNGVEKVLDEAIEERLTTLESMSETCLLMEHLELRVHCFFHLLPLAHRKSSLPQDEQDREVVDFGRDMTHLHQTLSKYMAPHKLKYLFEGLGYLCASIFMHSSQYITKLTESDRKRVCRNLVTVQKCISQLSGRPEVEINRALTFFKLVNHDVNQIFALIKESGESYSYLEYTYLLSLAVRSNPTMSSQPGALEAVLNQLRDNLLRGTAS